MTTERAEASKAEADTQAGAPEVARMGQMRPGLKPGGIGTGVAFDWALAAQLVIDATFFLLGTAVASDLAGKPLTARLIPALGSLVAAALIFTQGEALRRGRRVARIIQIVANSLLAILGLTNIPGLIHSVQVGEKFLGALVVEVVLLVVSPLIVWLLTRKRTGEWFASVTSAEARARHSGRWLLWMALYAVLGGVAVAFANYY